MATYRAEEPALDWAPHPGRMLQRELDARGISQAELAARAGLSTKHVNLVVKGNASLSSDVAVTLEQILGTPAEFWLSLEAAYQAQEIRAQRRESLASYSEWASRFPRDLLVARRVISAREAATEIVAKLLRLFRVASPSAFEKTWLEPQASYKRSQLHQIDPYLTALWLRLAEIEADDLLTNAATYDPDALREVAAKLPPLTTMEIADGFREAQRLLLGAGVALVFVPEISSTRICGVSRWVGGHPIIAVTSRYKTFDSFWFTLLHEIAHILMHPRRSTYIDFTGKAQDNTDARESDANSFAEETLIPLAIRSRVIAATTPEEIVDIANHLGISAGVVAGQRAFLTNDWGGAIAKLRSRGDLEIELGQVDSQGARDA